MKMAVHTPSRTEYDEGPLTKVLEEQTVIPTDTFLWAALGSIVGSLVLQFMGRPRTSLFVGQWVPTFLLLGVFHKITKGFGAERSPESDL